MKKIYLYLIEFKYYVFFNIIFIILLGLINYIYFFDIIYFFFKPLFLLNKNIYTSEINNYLIYTNLTDVLKSYIQFFIFLILYIYIPFLFIQIYFFFSNSLYKYEKNIFKYIIIFIFFIFLINSYIAYFILLPIIWHFFLSFQIISNTEIFNLYFEGRLDSYLSLLTSVLINLILGLNMPFILYILWYIKILNIKILTKYRKILYLSLIILSSIISPPDIISQSILIIFFFFIIEINILFIYILEKYKI